jgi:hypothetical protein
MGNEERRGDGMAETNDGDVPYLNDYPHSPSVAGIDSPDSVALQQTDLMNTLQAAMLLRGEIRCRLSKKFSCGYEIRPILWFSKRTPEIEATLKALGLTWKETFVRTEDIAKLCHAFHDFFNLSTKADGLKMVERLNGALPQPLDYDEVEESLALIERFSESLNTQSPSDEPRTGERT